MKQIIDILGIGFGPANIAVAIALEEAGLLENARFIEKNENSLWQPNMLLRGADIQNNALRDLVTPRNPMSKYTFINYLHTQERLFEYLNLPIHHTLRLDFSKYVEWVSSNFREYVDYGTKVESIELKTVNGEKVYRTVTDSGQEHFSRSLIMAPGRTPNIPGVFADEIGDNIFHLNDYRGKVDARAGAADGATVCVVGSSQSSIEIVLDLYDRYPACKIHVLMRGYGYRLKDTSPFSEQVYMPEFTDYYYNLPDRQKVDVNAGLRQTNYSSVDRDVVDKLYVLMYEDRLLREERIFMTPFSQVDAVEQRADKVRLSVQNRHTNESTPLDVDAVVLATGFKDLGTGAGSERYPALLDKVAPHFEKNGDGSVRINRDYSLEPGNIHAHFPPIYFNGLSESSHGFGDAGSFSLLSLRGEVISNAIAAALHLNREYARSAA